MDVAQRGCVQMADVAQVLALWSLGGLAFKLIYAAYQSCFRRYFLDDGNSPAFHLLHSANSNWPAWYAFQSTI